MSHHAATATLAAATAGRLHAALHSVSVWACLAALPVLLIAGYVERCYNAPFRNCWRCHGIGRFHPRHSRLGWRRCRRCRGTGLRLRIGRRVFNALYRLYADANHEPSTPDRR